MFLFVGLGNPGTKYENNRHNIGFMVVDQLVHHYSFGAYKDKYQGQLCEGTIADQKVMVLKPQTYMNESGRSVGEVCRFYKIPPENVYVFYDELDLELGKVRVKNGGGHGGHNGIRSIEAHIGKPFHRVRIGIDHPGHKELVTRHVLNDFSKAEWTEMDIVMREIVELSSLLLDGKDADFMTKLAERRKKDGI